MAVDLINSWMMAKTFCSLGRSQFFLKEARINEADGVGEGIGKMKKKSVKKSCFQLTSV